MDRLREFLEAIGKAGTAHGRFRGLLHILIGRRLSLSEGTLVSGGMTWRELAAQLKKYRWDPEAVRELGLDPAALPPRDRQKYWYSAIAQAGVNTPAASAEADALAVLLLDLGYVVGPGPGSTPPTPPATET